MTARLLRSLLLFTLAATPVPSFAQDTPVWSAIDCAQSKIAAPAGLRCQATQNYAGGQSGWAADAGGTYRNWMTRGHIDGVEYFYVLTEATSPGASISPSSTLHDSIRKEMVDGKDVKNFSSLEHREGADFITFNAASGASCVAIRRYGPGDYQWILNAVRCEPRGRTTNQGEIDRFIAGATYRAS